MFSFKKTGFKTALSAVSTALQLLSALPMALIKNQGMKLRIRHTQRASVAHAATVFDN